MKDKCAICDRPITVPSSLRGKIKPGESFVCNACHAASVRILGQLKPQSQEIH